MLGGQSVVPRAPAEISDAAELWARKSGRSAKVHFAPLAGWFVRLSLKPNDKAMKAWQEGRAPEPPTEDVFFHVKNPFEGVYMSVQDVLADARFKHLPLIDWWAGRKVMLPTYLQLDILQMGVSGVTAYLEREDTWSGRGQYASLDEETKKRQERDRLGKESLREKQETQAGERAKDRRRQIAKIPYLRILFGKNKQTGE